MSFLYWEQKRHKCSYSFPYSPGTTTHMFLLLHTLEKLFPVYFSFMMNAKASRPQKPHCNTQCHGSIHTSGLRKLTGTSCLWAVLEIQQCSSKCGCFSNAGTIKGLDYIHCILTLLNAIDLFYSLQFQNTSCYSVLNFFWHAMYNRNGI